jgi:hypothetical protein
VPVDHYAIKAWRVIVRKAEQFIPELLWTSFAECSNRPDAEGEANSVPCYVSGHSQSHADADQGLNKPQAGHFFGGPSTRSRVSRWGTVRAGAVARRDSIHFSSETISFILQYQHQNSRAARKTPTTITTMIRAEEISIARFLFRIHRYSGVRWERRLCANHGSSMRNTSRFALARSLNSPNPSA